MSRENRRGTKSYSCYKRESPLPVSNGEGRKESVAKPKGRSLHSLPHCPVQRKRGGVPQRGFVGRIQVETVSTKGRGRPPSAEWTSSVSRVEASWPSGRGP